MKAKEFVIKQYGSGISHWRTSDILEAMEEYSKYQLLELRELIKEEALDIADALYYIDEQME